MLRRTVSIFFVMLLTFSWFSFAAPAVLADETYYTRGNVKIRQTPSESGKQLAIIKGGEAVTVTGTSGNWFAIRYDSYRGYIRSDLLVKLTRSGYIPLELGNECPQVKEVQQRLYELGYFDGKRNGEFGKDTEAAVKAFQKRNGIGSDGIAGGETQRTLFASSAKAAAGASTATTPPQMEIPTLNTPSTGGTTSSDTLKKGDSGTAVKEFQQLLKNLGYITFTPDGVFGSGTETAVKLFQSANGLTSDGKVGPATLAKLKSGSAVPKVTATPTASPSTSTSLKRGDSGAEVTKMQKRLKELGYISFSADGEFGSGTRDGVIAFQKKNGLKDDGIAGPTTLTLLYSSNAKKASSSSSSGSSSSSSSSSSSVDTNKVKLLHFFNNVKPKYPSGTVVTVTDPATGITWKLRFMSMGRHADSEPLTTTDTVNMNRAFGGIETWTPKAVYVTFPDGVTSLATMHNVQHLSGTIANNNFDGHLCVHFLRDMDECRKNDPNYGVQHQNAIRKAWKALTGQTIN